MTTPNASSAPAPPAPPPVTSGAVIRRIEAAEETPQERLLKKHIPAWVVSGAMHVVIIALMILVLGTRGTVAQNTDKVLNTTAAKTDEPADPDLTNDDLGLQSNFDAALPHIEEVAERTVEFIETNDALGRPDVTEPNPTTYAPPGLVASDFNTAGTTGLEGAMKLGDGGAGGHFEGGLNGRRGATKSRLLREGGGNEASEQAVALALAWLARQQKNDGSWEFDMGRKDERAAATGLALLPFLAAGETHKKTKDRVKDYSQTVSKGLGYLIKICPLGGANAGRMSGNMYAQGIATIALCEAYGMTKDPALRPYAQAAINYIQRAQGPNGSWGYSAGTDGDTSIVGWQIQALQAAKLTKDLVVNDRVIKKAIDFLNFASAGSRKAMYGYRNNVGASPGTALTAVGLLCRYYIDSNWGPSSPGMIEGVAGLMRNPPVGSGELKNMYYYYYATQVVHFYEGEEWKTWNEGPKQPDGTRKGGMRDWLVQTQEKKDTNNRGSWNPENGWFGRECGRLGTTAIAALTLEVYYRHLPTYKRGANGNDVRILEDK
ncbi:MAG: terpene cyclase/mutase family protein [Gemmataceae bacterium]|nr:terpene cyclase/mutase family protein [Gemmata sp.]MDW8197259.1 terpene cyclase/mutase family protein [Gemmataceae bacterium]